jgi:hypothetical protein
MEFIQSFLVIMAIVMFFGFLFTIQQISFLKSDVERLQDLNREMMRELTSIKYKIKD